MTAHLGLDESRQSLGKLGYGCKSGNRLFSEYNRIRGSQPGVSAEFCLRIASHTEAATNPPNCSVTNPELIDSGIFFLSPAESGRTVRRR